MSRKKVTVAALTVVLVAALGGLLAYRLAPGRQSAAKVDAGSPGNAPCIDLDKAAQHVGETACVAGRVLRVFTSRGGNTFLDFCQDYRQCPFTSIIFASDRAKFGMLDRLTGRRVEIRGKIELYNGRAEIVIHDAEQIKAP